eukprot:2038281-Rhodomonas_salina.2
MSPALTCETSSRTQSAAGQTNRAGRERSGGSKGEKKNAMRYLPTLLCGTVHRERGDKEPLLLLSCLKNNSNTSKRSSARWARWLSPRRSLYRWHTTSNRSSRVGRCIAVGRLPGAAAVHGVLLSVKFPRLTAASLAWVFTQNAGDKNEGGASSKAGRNPPLGTSHLHQCFGSAVIQYKNVVPRVRPSVRVSTFQTVLEAL